VLKLRSILVTLMFTFLSACMTTQALDLKQQPTRSAELSSVPFFPQEEFHCGPSTLAMVMNYWGLSLTPDELAPDLYLPGREGSLTIEMVSQSRQRGFIPQQLKPSLAAIVQAIEEGTPVIVRQNNGLSWYPLWHYAVVIGVDAERGHFILRSGPTERLSISWSVLDRTWARADRWAIRLLPVDREWPASVVADDVLQVLLDMRQGNPQAAQQGLTQALQRWPDQPVLWLAQAELVAQQENAQAGEQVLRDGLLALPEQPFLLNNLAYSLLQRGLPQQALPLVKRAAELSDHPAIVSTLAEVRRALP